MYRARVDQNGPHVHVCHPPTVSLHRSLLPTLALISQAVRVRVVAQQKRQLMPSPSPALCFSPTKVPTSSSPTTHLSYCSGCRNDGESVQDPRTRTLQTSQGLGEVQTKVNAAFRTVACALFLLTCWQVPSNSRWFLPACQISPLAATSPWAPPPSLRKLLHPPQGQL